jgi:hypothetical protein
MGVFKFMDEREPVIKDFMNWLANSGYELALFNKEISGYVFLGDDECKEAITKYLDTTGITQEWKLDTLLDTGNSES